MTEIQQRHEKGIDIVEISEILDDHQMQALAQTISTLRQQGSQRILCLAHRLHKVQCTDLNSLKSPVKIFSQTGGKITFAELDEKFRRQFEKTSWYRFLNFFKTREEAFSFLDPHHSHD